MHASLRSVRVQLAPARAFAAVTMSTRASTTQLEVASAVTKWLDGTPFEARDVRRIHVGTTNYAYRVFLRNPLDEGRVWTAVLKYSAPYTAGEPRAAFSPKRQAFEARALTHIPWWEFKYNTEHDPASQPEHPIVKLPSLYLQDPDHSVNIIEDCTPRPEEREIWDQSTHSFRTILEDLPESSAKHELARLLGDNLGTFLAQLHAWGSDTNNHQFVFDTFGGNSAAKELTIQELFTDFAANVKRLGYTMTGSQPSQIESRLQSIENAVRSEPQSVAMGDFW